MGHIHPPPLGRLWLHLFPHCTLGAGGGARIRGSLPRPVLLPVWHVPPPRCPPLGSPAPAASRQAQGRWGSPAPTPLALALPLPAPAPPQCRRQRGGQRGARVSARGRGCGFAAPTSAFPVGLPVLLVLVAVAVTAAAIVAASSSPSPSPSPPLPSSASTSASTSTSAGTPAAAPPAILVTLPGLSSPPPPTPPSAAATSSAAALAPPASRPRSKSDEGKHHVGGWKERAMETCSKLKSGVKDITHSVKEDLQVVLDGEPRERQMPDGTRVIVYPLLPALLFGTPTVPGSLNLNEDYEGYDDRHHKPSTEWQSVTPGPPPPPNVQFLALDSATRALPNVSTIPELVNALQSTITHSTTSAAAASDQWQLLRAIYVWVAENITYDVDAYRTGTRLPCDPQSVFSMRKGVCQGISNLTVKLCVLCGIHARVVLGWGKGAGYQEGQQLGQPNHAWVLARIPGSGDYLLDVAWAAGACDATLTRFIKQFSACWFGTDPSLFALTHLPHPPHTRFALLPNAELPSCTTFESAKFYPTGFIQRLVDSGFPQRSLATLATSRGASTGVAKLPDPSNLDRIVRLGFSPDEIVNISLAGGDLVHAYDTDPGVSISVLQAPLTHIIKRGTSHIIRIKSNTEMGVAFEIGGKWTHLAKKGTTFEAELQATKDGKVGLLCSKDLRNFQCILEWVVV